MFSFLRQPYPVKELRFTRSIWQSLLFGAAIGFILVVFQPFGSYNWQHPSKSWLLAGYGLAAAFSIFLNLYGFRKLLPKLFEESSWTVGKEIIWHLLNFATGGFLSTVYGFLIGIMPFTLWQVSTMTLFAFLTGFFPAIVLVYVNYLYLIHQYRPLTPTVITSPVSEPLHVEDVLTTDELLVLTAENEKDTICLAPAQLLFVEASDNYCTVFHVEAGKLSKKLLRSSLSRLENQINASHIVRCHRSYIVNLEQVKSVTGNAQGYKLHFDLTEQLVPVARTYSQVVRSSFAAC